MLYTCERPQTQAMMPGRDAWRWRWTAQVLFLGIHPLKSADRLWIWPQYENILGRKVTTTEYIQSLGGRIDWPKSPLPVVDDDEWQDNGQSHAFVNWLGDSDIVLCWAERANSPINIKQIRKCNFDVAIVWSMGSLIIFRPKSALCVIDFDENRKIANKTFNCGILHLPLLWFLQWSI